MKNKTENRRVGYFGEFGGQFVPEMIMPALHQLETVHAAAMRDAEFQSQYEQYLED